MNVEERKLAVLRAIVEDFIATREPVGSKALVATTSTSVRPPSATTWPPSRTRG